MLTLGVSSKLFNRNDIIARLAVRPGPPFPSREAEPAFVLHGGAQTCCRVVALLVLQSLHLPQSLLQQPLTPLQMSLRAGQPLQCGEDAVFRITRHVCG